MFPDAGLVFTESHIERPVQAILNGPVRVDIVGDEAVIIDYKSSDVHEQAVADRRAKKSLQLLTYALAWQHLHGRLPPRVEPRFLETGLIGRATYDQDDMTRATELIQEAEQGIRKHEFQANPSDFSCRWLAFQAVCHSAFQVS